MAELAVTAPATYKQPSRKGKKAWRKNVDLTEVQQGLEEVREEIIQGGIISERDSSALFATDLVGDENIVKKQGGQKLLKVDEILGRRSAVPALDGKKRKLDDKIATVPSKKLKNGTYVTHKELQRLKAAADNVNGGFTAEGSADYDPWAEPVKTNDPRFTFLEEVKKPRAPDTMKQAPTSLAANGKSVPNVPKPDAGKSYNPLVGDWTALLEREGAAAVESEKKRLAAEAAEAAREQRAAEEAAKVEAAEQLEYATDIDSAWESEWDGFQSDREVFTQKLKPRKTPSERNRVKARKEREAREKAERKDKERAVQEKRIKEIAKEVSAKDKARHAHAVALHRSQRENDDSSASETEEVILRRQRFGKLPLPEAPLELVLPDELEDSLRRLKPEGNLMQDRYRNLLINGKLEVRKKIWQHKKARRTTTEKWSYKDWKLR